MRAPLHRRVRRPGVSAGAGGGQNVCMTTGTPFTVRTPVPEDAPGIARVHTQSWRETYTGLVPERFFDDDALRRREETWTRMLAEPSRRVRVRVAVVGETIIGFAGTGQPREDDPAREHALHLLYVLREHHGTGAGQALLDAVLGGDPAQLWVAEANPRAIRFYERNGFRADSASLTDPGLEDLREVRMVR